MASSTEKVTGKIFVGGLAPTTTEESLISYFGMFGEVKQAQVIRDKKSNRSRCFGFLIFCNQVVADMVLAMHMHQIDDRIVECKDAVPRTTFELKESYENQMKKIFVGGIPYQTTETELSSYFEKKYGKVTELIIIRERTTNKSKGFGFVSFQDVSSVEKVLEDYDNHFVAGKWIDCKRALTKDQCQILPIQTSPSKSARKESGQKYGSFESDQISLPNEGNPSVVWRQRHSFSTNLPEESKGSKNQNHGLYSIQRRVSDFAPGLNGSLLNQLYQPPQPPGLSKVPQKSPSLDERTKNYSTQCLDSISTSSRFQEEPSSRILRKSFEEFKLTHSTDDFFDVFTPLK